MTEDHGLWLIADITPETNFKSNSLVMNDNGSHAASDVSNLEADIVPRTHAQRFINSRLSNEQRRVVLPLLIFSKV